MNKQSVRRFPWMVGAGGALAGLCVGILGLHPVAARVQQPPAPVLRNVAVSVSTSDRTQTPSSHWGIYALAEYDYAANGKMTVVKKNELITEEDGSLARGGWFTGLKLKTGEYEIHVQTVNSRPIVKRFIVNNLSNSTVPLVFNVAPIEDPTEQKKTELVRIGPSLADMDARLQALEKKNGLAAVGSAGQTAE